MNINNKDIHYNKYIKYKTKYLELKEQRGSGIGELFNKSTIKEEKIFETNFDLLKDNKCKIDNYLNYNKDNISKIISSVEDLLLNIILPQLYIYNNKTDYQQIIINIYKSFCNTINTYRSKQNIKEILGNNVSQLSIINTGLDKINTSYKIDLPVLKKTISLYFQFLNTCIEQHIQFDKTNKNICEVLNDYLNHFLKDSNNFKNNKFMVEKLLTSTDKLLYAVHQSNSK
jgi:hypothetical protein